MTADTERHTSPVEHADSGYARPPMGSEPGSPSADATLRTWVGTPRYRVRGMRGVTRGRVAIAAVSALTLASVVGVGVWKYLQHQRSRRRLDARAQRWVRSVGRVLSEQDPLR